ncbi:hypothetical protein PoB_005552200 [Plakobranchus ocellatus]|uniref:Uncharacterized protein n=1 Tax=Plakobranchus ocellatus TaxID=259542 RepID=A0AAV4CCE6_9GAST|nr:hypothetical protein PoB_005552200 [Plakobranchus ocellatus]
MSIHSFLLEAQYSFASRRSHGPIVTCSFPNSEKVKKFKSARTKTSSISKFTTNENTNSLIREFRKLPFSKNSDGFHSVNAKPYPVVIFPDAHSQTISSQVLSIPILKEASTGENKVDLSIKEFEKHGILLAPPASAPSRVSLACALCLVSSALTNSLLLSASVPSLVSPASVNRLVSPAYATNTVSPVCAPSLVSPIYSNRLVSPASAPSLVSLTFSNIQLLPPLHSACSYQLLSPTWSQQPLHPAWSHQSKPLPLIWSHQPTPTAWFHQPLHPACSHQPKPISCPYQPMPLALIHQPKQQPAPTTTSPCRKNGLISLCPQPGMISLSIELDFTSPHIQPACFRLN